MRNAWRYIHDNVIAPAGSRRFDQFTFDITQALQNAAGASHELLVQVTDPSGLPLPLPLPLPPYLLVQTLIVS